MSNEPYLKLIRTYGRNHEGVSKTLGNSNVQIQIVTFNSAATLVSCLKSVFRQSFQAINVLVIDNASSDSSLSILKNYGESLRILRNDENKGYAKAHNQGFQYAIQAGVEAVLTLNPDVELEDDYVSLCVSALRQDNTLAGVMGKLLNASNPGVLDTTGIVLNRWFQPKDRGYGEDDLGQFDNTMDVIGICGAAAMYSMKALQSLYQSRGYILDESFVTYKEDVEISLAMRDQNWSFCYNYQAQAFHHRGWKPGTKASDELRIQSQLNQLSLLWAFYDRNINYYILNLAEFARCSILALQTGKFKRIFLSLYQVYTRSDQKRRSLNK